MSLKQVRIKGGSCIVANFSKSPRTLYNELQSDAELWRGVPRRDEVYVFVSVTGRQILFVEGTRKVRAHAGTRYESEQELLSYRGWRIEGGCFNPKMLENYANNVGYTFNMPTLQDWYDKWYADRH